MKYAKMLLFLVCMIQIDVYNMDPDNKRMVMVQKENQDHSQLVVQNQYISENYNQRITPNSYGFFPNFNLFNLWGENRIPNQNGVFDFNGYMRQNSKTWQHHIFNYYSDYAKENNVSVSTSAIWVKRDSTNMECLFKNKPNHECNEKCRKYNDGFINAIFALQVEIGEKKTVLKNTDIMHKFITENIKSELKAELQKKDSKTVKILEQSNEGHEAAKKIEEKKQKENLQNRPWYEKHPRAACAASFFASFVIFHPTFCINFCVNSASLFFEWLVSKKTT